jgi:hypothetical protein
MASTKAFDLDRLFEGALRRLKIEAEYFSRLTDHDPELGRLNETHLVKMLRDYLPPKIGIGTGFIVSGGSRKPSPQCDIVLYNALNNAPLYKSEAWSIYPIEMVYGVIEVKTTLKPATLKEAFKNCAAIRSMAKTSKGKPNKTYMRRKSSAEYEIYKCGLAPRFFVFGYGGWKDDLSLERNFKPLSNMSTQAHIHGVCHLNDSNGSYIKHRPHKKGEDRFGPVEANGFRRFLMSLPAMLDSMLPIWRIGLGFDQVYLKHYDLDGT